MKPAGLLLLRVAAAELVWGIVRPYAVGVAIVLAGLLALDGWLAATHSAWWLVFMAPLGLLTLVYGGLLTMLWRLVRLTRGRADRQQRLEVATFVGQVREVAEAARTPYPLLLALSVKDIVLRRNDVHIGRLIRSSAQLYNEFQRVSAQLETTPPVKKT